MLLMHETLKAGLNRSNQFARIEDAIAAIRAGEMTKIEKMRVI